MKFTLLKYVKKDGDPLPDLSDAIDEKQFYTVLLQPSQMSPFTLLNSTNNNKQSTQGKLDIDIKYDDMLETVLIKLNDFRAPDNQILSIYNEYGQNIPLTYNIRSDLTLYYTTGAVG